jgi:hypothetical protein
MQAYPVLFSAMTITGVPAFVQQVWFWAIAVLKFILWLMALVVVWLTLWARQLRKRTDSQS